MEQWDSYVGWWSRSPWSWAPWGQGHLVWAGSGDNENTGKGKHSGSGNLKGMGKGKHSGSGNDEHTAKGKDKNYGYVKGKQIGSGNLKGMGKVKQSGSSKGKLAPVQDSEGAPVQGDKNNNDKIMARTAVPMAAASAAIEVSPRGRQSGSDGEAEANPQAKAKGQPKRQWTQIPFRWFDKKNRLPERRKFKPWNRGLDKQLCPIKSTRVENGNSSRNQNGHEWASNGSPRARIDRMLFISLLAPMPYFLGVFCTPTGIKNTDLYIFLFST